jgi:hypothetical protein
VLAGAVEDETWKRKGEIEWVVEHRWVTAALGTHWIGVQKERGRLATVGSRGDGGPVKKLSSGKEMVGK